MDFNRYSDSQKGFLLPIALFLIVTASGVALVVSKQLEQSALLSVDQILYDKSFYAAEMGAQLGMNKLLFMPNSIDMASEHTSLDVNEDTNKKNNADNNIKTAIDIDLHKPNNVHKTSYDIQCKALNIKRVFSLTELKNCKLKVSCRSQAAGADSNHYTIESIAICGILDIALNSPIDSTLDNPVDKMLDGSSLSATEISAAITLSSTQASTEADTADYTAVELANNSSRDIVSRGRFSEVVTQKVIISRVFKRQ
jgi:hypothetical protein